MRIITVPVNLTKTHSGLIMPGDRVDVVVTFKTHVGDRRNIAKTKTLLEYIKVFAADNIRQSGANSSETSEYDAKNISLLVSPDQYNMCIQAQQMGTLSLALRRKDDDAVAEAHEYDEDVLSDASTSFAKAEAKEQDPIRSGEDVRNFLEQQDNGQAQAAVSTDPSKKPEPAAGPPQWTIKIYAGQEVREAKVDLPEEAAETGKPASALPPEADKTSKGKTDNKPGWLKSFLNGA
jgi:pilus assembly protein CpaB